MTPTVTIPLLPFAAFVALVVLLTLSLMARHYARHIASNRVADESHKVRLIALSTHETAATLKPLIDPDLLKMFVCDLMNELDELDPVSIDALLTSMIIAGLTEERASMDFLKWVDGFIESI